MKNTTMGERIARLRREKGMTQEEIAEKLGVSAQAVSKWENNICCPDIAIIPKMATLFGVSTDMLLGVEAKEQSKEKDDKQSEAKPQTKSREWSFTLKSALPAVFVLLLGGSLLWNSLAELGIGFWRIALIDAIIALGLGGVISRITPFSLGALALGIIYHLVTFDVIRWTDKYDGIIIPILIILVGLSMFYNTLSPKKRGKWKLNGTKLDKSTSFSASEDDGVLGYTLKFGDDCYHINSEVFRGGEISIAFSDATLDFGNVRDVADGAVLDVSVAFGALTLLLPKSIAIVDGGTSGIFSDRKEKNGSPNADAKPLTLSSSISFGELNIRYI